jgi:hypothetical protein
MAALALLATALAASAQGVTREEALASTFPGATIEAQRLFLTADQQTRAEARSGQEVPSALVARYVARRENQVVGRAYVDTHVVRTKRESLLIALEADGGLRRIDVTAFLEPLEYRAPERWMRQYQGRRLDDDLAIDRAIRPLAGATLTTRATNAAVRRVLALDAVLTRDGNGDP